MISIVNFSENPSGRYVTDGPNSGQRFRDEILVPALDSGSGVTVSLDGALGFGSSFLEEAFGGLVRLGYKATELRNRMKIVTKIGIYEKRIWRYIDEEAGRRGLR